MVSRIRRGPVVALVALLVVLAAPVQAGASRTEPGHPVQAKAHDHRGHTDFTPAEAREVLAKAKGQIRRDTRRVRDGEPVGVGESTDITMTLRDLFRARTELSGTDRQVAETLLSRPSDVGGDDVGAATAVSYPTTGRGHWCPSGGVACMHWVKSGTEKVSATDSDANGVPDFVETVHSTIQQVWTSEIDKMGYRQPLPDGGTTGDADNPTPDLDIYLADLGSRGLYGYCAPEGSVSVHKLSGYCVLDNDYATAQYGTSPLSALRVTAAHEFFHMIQFAYDVDEDAWFMEGTATWVEDEVYDSINDNRQFLAYSPLRYPTRPLDYTPGLHRYGSWLFFRYASERLGATIVRQFWESADSDGPRYSLQAVRAVVGSRTSWPTFAVTFGAWNTLPPGSYSERAGYPSPVWNLQKTLTSTSTSTGWRTVNLPHLSSSAIKVAPHSKLSTRKKLEVRINAPYASKGSTALVQRRLRDGRVFTRVLTLDKYGDGRIVYAFDRTVISSVVVVVTNSSTSMKDCGTVTSSDGPVYSCVGRGVYDSNQPYKVLARLI